MPEQHAVLAAAGARMAGTPVLALTAAAAGNTCSPSGARLPASRPDRPRPQQGQPGEGILLAAQVPLPQGRQGKPGVRQHHGRRHLHGKNEAHMLANQLRFNDEIKKYGGYVYNVKHAAKLRVGG